ncbi:3254_t:CDS:2 [Ambispora gerdemannii]|uniref:3254_t:CDS:1 n=1 Tax=Ambispora gerdemannii TaxID=144530 RepID=A0A9N9G9J8_9GLOM|nr:3254_t:CDS:2 [Ambispora gerdemannii]
MELLYAIVGKNMFNYVILAILLFSVRKTTSSPPTSIIPPVDPTIQKLKQDILSLQNEINKMRTEAEWKSEARTSATSHRSEYPVEIETLWVEFTVLFDERRKREKRSPTKMYNVLSEEIGLSPSTLAKFYQHQKSPQRTSLDKIENWIEREGKKKDTYFGSSNEFNDDSYYGMKGGPAMVLVDFAKEVKEKKLRAFSSYRSLREVLLKYDLDSDDFSPVEKLRDITRRQLRKHAERIRRGFITFCPPYHMRRHTKGVYPEQISQGSKRSYIIEFTDEALIEDSEEYHTLCKSVKKDRGIPRQKMI